jgi:methylenetetrahydrofolate reductase (NADPH)
VGTLLDDFSLEMTGKDVTRVQAAASLIPGGTRINVTFLENEDLQLRVDAAGAVSHLGFTPVPHISARRIESAEHLAEFLAALQVVHATQSVFAVGGDPAVPEGPYEDSLAVIESGLLQRYGVRDVSVSGYPDGHPGIAGHVLWSHLERKAAALARTGLGGSVTTQVEFDAGRVLSWLAELREHGIELPARVGVPGPASVRLLLGFAARLGVSTSAAIARKYGLSVTSLLGQAGPEHFLRELAAGLDPGRHGQVKLHFYTFGGFTATADWIARHRTEF